MALEVQVYKDILSYEPKVLFSMSWRQLGSLSTGTLIGGTIYVAVTLMLHASGLSWQDATDWALYVIIPIVIPFAVWGWWRPKGLKPEQYIGYVINHHCSRKVIIYADEYRRLDAGRPAATRRKRRQAKKRAKAHLAER